MWMGYWYSPYAHMLPIEWTCVSSKFETIEVSKCRWFPCDCARRTRHYQYQLGNYQPHPSALGLIPSNGPRGRLRASAKSLFWVTARKLKKKSERLVISPTIACQIHTANPRVLTLGRRGLRFLWKQLPLFLHMEGGSNALGITNKFLINCSQNDRK